MSAFLSIVRQHFVVSDERYDIVDPTLGFEEECEKAVEGQSDGRRGLLRTATGIALLS